MLVPKLRFKREDGTDYPEWNKNKWSGLGDFIGSGTLSKSDLSDTGTPCILYGELYTKYGEVAHTIYSKTSAETHTFSKADDVILPKSGETPEDISTATCVPYDNISLGGDLIVFRHNERVIGAYLSYLISNKAKNAIASIAQGKSIVHINEKSLSNIELPYPEIEEQQKIANFLSTVDEVIAQSEAEVANLQQQKKAAMQKIFSQEVRFKREDGTSYPEWEEKKFGKIMSCYSGGTPSSKNKQYYNGDIPFIRSGEIHSSKTVLFLSEEGLNNSAAKMVNIGDLLYALYGATSGEVDISKINGAINQAILCIVPHNDNRIYLKYWLECFKVIITSKLLQGGQGNLSSELIKGLLINIPCLEEQQKIADFLATYDEAISCAKQELDKWKELKKGLLQQMFA